MPPVKFAMKPASRAIVAALAFVSVGWTNAPSREGLRLADGTVIRSVLPAAPTAIVRPEKISVLPAGAPRHGNALDGEILQAVYSGASVTYRIRVAVLGDEPLLAFVQASSGDVLAPGQPVLAQWSPGQTVPLPQ